MTEERPGAVKEQLDALTKAVENFHAVHPSYHETLQDGDDIDAYNGYCTSVIREFQDVQNEALQWLEKNETSGEEDTQWQEKVKLLSALSGRIKGPENHREESLTD